MRVHALADAEEVVFGAAGEPEEFELFGGGGGIGNEFGGFFDVGGGGKAADPGEGIEMGEAEVEGLAAAHGKAGEGAVFAVFVDAVAGFDGGDDVVEEVAREDGEGGGGFEDVAAGTVVFLRAAVG